MKFRQAIPEDLAFVRSAWSSSYRTSPYAGCLAMETYAKAMHSSIDAILTRPGTSCIVAFDPKEADDDVDFLYGFLVTRTDTATPYVYYVYTKTAYREKRIAARLFETACIDRTRRFEYACRAAIADKYPHADWSPLTGRFQNLKSPK